MPKRSEAVDEKDVVERVVQAVLARLGPGHVEAARRIAAEVVRGARLPIAPAEGHVTPRGAAMPAPPGAQPSVDYCVRCVEQEKTRGRERAVITTTGRNRKGIVARLTQTVADAGGDILDISQTLVGDYFTMIIVVDVSNLDVSFAEFKQCVTRECGALELQALIMHEDVMRSLQRV